MDCWLLTTVYGPCTEPARFEFVNWFKNHHIGDFNFYRSLHNRNKPGGNLADTLIFNDAIGHLGLVELQLKGRAFTWSNMQNDPLLEQLDWFFTSANWTIDYPNSEVIPMAKITSDHILCKVSIGTNTPRPTSLGSRTFGWSMPASLTQCRINGQFHPLPPRQLETSQLSSKGCEVH